GAAFAPDAEIVAIDAAEPDRAPPRELAAELYGALPATLDGLRTAAGGGGPKSERETWIGSLRAVEEDARAGEAADLADDRSPLHPMRVYGELIGCSTATRSWLATGATSCPTPAGYSTHTSRGAGSTPARSAAWAAAPATPWPPSSPVPSARSCCCSATGRSASPAWSSTPWPATASPSSRSSATTASGRSRSTRWRRSTATRSSPT